MGPTEPRSTGPFCVFVIDLIHKDNALPLDALAILLMNVSGARVGHHPYEGGVNCRDSRKTFRRRMELVPITGAAIQIQG
jgi:selenophosphate synthetase-related protein